MMLAGVQDIQTQGNCKDQAWTSLKIVQWPQTKFQPIGHSQLLISDICSHLQGMRMMRMMAMQLTLPAPGCLGRPEP